MGIRAQFCRARIHEMSIAIDMSIIAMIMSIDMYITILADAIRPQFYIRCQFTSDANFTSDASLHQMPHRTPIRTRRQFHTTGNPSHTHGP